MKFFLSGVLTAAALVIAMVDANATPIDCHATFRGARANCNAQTGDAQDPNSWMLLNLADWGFSPAAKPGQNSDPAYDINFTDSNGDIAHLIFNTASNASPTGTSITSISGTFDGHSVTEIVVFGADQLLYSTQPIVDYHGVGFQDDVTHDDFNLYWTNPTRSGSGEYGLCYQGSCDSVSGFYAVTFIPEPASLALLGAGLLAAAGVTRRRKILRH